MKTLLNAVISFDVFIVGAIVIIFATAPGMRISGKSCIDNVEGKAVTLKPGVFGADCTREIQYAINLIGRGAIVSGASQP